MAAWEGLVSLSRLIERQGTTPEVRSDAKAGCLRVGIGRGRKKMDDDTEFVAGLAAHVGLDAKAVRRQLRCLEHLGLIATEQGPTGIERHPATGRVTSSKARAPAKVIRITLASRHLRVSQPRSGADRPAPAPVSGADRPGTSSSFRGGSPGFRQNPQTPTGSGDFRQGQPQTAGFEGRRPRSPGTDDARQRQAPRKELPPWARPGAEALGLGIDEFLARAKDDKDRLRLELIEAQIDPTTGRRMPLWEQRRQLPEALLAVVQYMIQFEGAKNADPEVAALKDRARSLMAEWDTVEAPVVPAEGLEPPVSTADTLEARLAVTRAVASTDEGTIDTSGDEDEETRRRNGLAYIEGFMKVRERAAAVEAEKLRQTVAALPRRKRRRAADAGRAAIVTGVLPGGDPPTV
jgi:hypothetical protein